MNVSLFKIFGGVLLVFLSIGMANAEEAGSGSSVECDSDIWSCIEWSECSPEGLQERKCILKEDCMNSEMPRPPESQECTPIPTCSEDEWSCSEYGACIANIQSRECTLTYDCPYAANAPAINRECIPEDCTEPFDCSEWSSCNSSGYQKRSCTLKADCVRQNPDLPEIDRICPGLQCTHLKTAQERVACRLLLSEAERITEDAILYVPEQCRNLADKDGQRKCKEQYLLFDDCKTLPLGAERVACGRRIAGISSLEEAHVHCIATSSKVESFACVQQLKAGVKRFAHFLLYLLEWQAQELLELQVQNLEAVTDWILFSEEQKTALELSAETAEWKQILLHTQQRWSAFTSSIQ